MHACSTCMHGCSSYSTGHYNIIAICALNVLFPSSNSKLAILYIGNEPENEVPFQSWISSLDLPKIIVPHSSTFFYCREENHDEIRCTKAKDCDQLTCEKDKGEICSET